MDAAMRIVAIGAGRLIIVKGCMDELFISDIFMAVVTQLGPDGCKGEGMAISVSLVTELTGIVAFTQWTVNSGT